MGDGCLKKPVDLRSYAQNMKQLRNLSKSIRTEKTIDVMLDVMLDLMSHVMSYVLPDVV